MTERRVRIPRAAGWLLDRILPAQEISHLNGSFEDLAKVASMLKGSVATHTM
mgnify:CR=1 FL=1